MVTPGSLSPIETVIEEAEARAEAEWRAEHEPCPHDLTVQDARLGQLPKTICARCGQDITWKGTNG